MIRLGLSLEFASAENLQRVLKSVSVEMSQCCLKFNCTLWFDTDSQFHKNTASSLNSLVACLEVICFLVDFLNL